MNFIAENTSQLNSAPHAVENGTISQQQQQQQDDAVRRLRLAIVERDRKLVALSTSLSAKEDEAHQMRLALEKSRHHPHPHHHHNGGSGANRSVDALSAILSASLDGVAGNGAAFGNGYTHNDADKDDNRIVWSGSPKRSQPKPTRNSVGRGGGGGDDDVFDVVSVASSIAVSASPPAHYHQSQQRGGYASPMQRAADSYANHQNNGAAADGNGIDASPYQEDSELFSFDESPSRGVGAVGAREAAAGAKASSSSPAPQLTTATFAGGEKPHVSNNSGGKIVNANSGATGNGPLRVILRRVAELEEALASARDDNALLQHQLTAATMKNNNNATTTTTAPPRASLQHTNTAEHTSPSPSPLHPLGPMRHWIDSSVIVMQAHEGVFTIVYDEAEAWNALLWDEYTARKEKKKKRDEEKAAILKSEGGDSVRHTAAAIAPTRTPAPPTVVYMTDDEGGDDAAGEVVKGGRNNKNDRVGVKVKREELPPRSRPQAEVVVSASGGGGSDCFNESKHSDNKHTNSNERGVVHYNTSDNTAAALAEHFEQSQIQNAKLTEALAFVLNGGGSSSSFHHQHVSEHNSVISVTPPSRSHAPLSHPPSDHQLSSSHHNHHYAHHHHRVNVDAYCGTISPPRRDTDPPVANATSPNPPHPNPYRPTISPDRFFHSEKEGRESGRGERDSPPPQGHDANERKEEAEGLSFLSLLKARGAIGGANADMNFPPQQNDVDPYHHLVQDDQKNQQQHNVSENYWAAQSSALYLGAISPILHHRAHHRQNHNNQQAQDLILKEGGRRGDKFARDRELAKEQMAKKVALLYSETAALMEKAKHGSRGGPAAASSRTSSSLALDNRSRSSSVNVAARRGVAAGQYGGVEGGALPSSASSSRATSVTRATATTTITPSASALLPRPSGYRGNGLVTRATVDKTPLRVGSHLSARSAAAAAAAAAHEYVDGGDAVVPPPYGQRRASADLYPASFAAMTPLEAFSYVADVSSAPLPPSSSSAALNKQLSSSRSSIVRGGGGRDRLLYTDVTAGLY